MNNINRRKKAVELLPSYFQTAKNKKFLSATLDTLYQTPALKRIDGFVGSKITPTYNSQRDVYISDSSTTPSKLRDKYSYQPALVITNAEDQVKYAFGFDDLVGQMSNYGADIGNFNKVFPQEFSAYDPRIDWDKFTNFREYYWIPTGPASITISGVQQETVSTFSVTDSADGNFFVFTPDGVTSNPLLTFYKGVTYVLNVNSTNGFYIKYINQNGINDALTDSDGVLNNGTSNGQIIFTVPDNAPGMLYYGTDNATVTIGTILIRNIEENSILNIDNEILGKSQYRTGPTTNSPNGIEFINGLKVRFVGNVQPSSYLNREFIVEGVGNAIQLIDFSTLQTPEGFASLYDDDFDITSFDNYPFDGFETLPLVPEYITINRASRDLNSWTRYNRWFHKDVIDVVSRENADEVIYSLDLRAQRPIIEFMADLQLFNFGNNAIAPVDIFDTEVTDAFSLVEGTNGYVSDGVQLQAGHTVIFNADSDPMVRGKVFEVTLSEINGVSKINLVEIISPLFGTNVVITQGTANQSTEWWFNGVEWVAAQARTKLNQAPLFDLFDKDGRSYSDRNFYDAIFNGNKVFGYAIGPGTNDPILGFPLKYRSVGLTGTYLFENYFTTETLSLLSPNEVIEVPTANTFLKVNNASGTRYVNVWTRAEPYQLAVQQFQSVNSSSSISITVFNDPGNLTDLEVSIFANSKRLVPETDYRLVKAASQATIEFVNEFISYPVNVLINCYSSATPNESGAYEIPLSMFNNPLNGPISEFTLSELSDHVQTMINRSPDFVGSYPGISNLKSIPSITKYGSRLIVNHNPLSFAQMFISNVEHSALNASRQAAEDYYQFKLGLLREMINIDINFTIEKMLDQVLSELIKNKNSSFPYAESDMVAYGSNTVDRRYTVTDSRNVLYPIADNFDLAELSFRSVLVYLNDVLLLEGRDYTFDLELPNVEILAALNKNDIVVIKDYRSTIGSYIPPTPTKLGLFPKYEPEIYKDTSYSDSPVMVIQGHDGSLTVAYTSVEDAELSNYDYRDLVLLEFEKRVFNNIKVQYNTDLLNIDQVLPSVFRDQSFGYDRVFAMMQGDFVKWASTYGLDYIKNTTFEISNHKTYNYRSAQDVLFNDVVPGNWRGVYKYYFDTDRPNTHPWEMLGFRIKPTWWNSEYGPAPYTAGNLNMWQDLEEGRIRHGNRQGIDPIYARPGLSQIIPVDSSGNVVDVRGWASMGLNGFIDSPEQDWRFGDHGPVETAWRRSSLWPFAVQIAMILTNPGAYASKLFDTSRMAKDLTGKYRYSTDNHLLNPSLMYLNGDRDALGNTVQSSGYSTWVIEKGKLRSLNYLSELKEDLENIDFNLFYKTGGFLNKNKLEILIDSVSPETASPGSLLPNEDYVLHFNKSNPIDNVSMSGIIVEKSNGKFRVRGYDRNYPYFNVKMPLHRQNDIVITVGGKSPPFLIWTENTLYQAGQIVRNNNIFYNVPNSLNSGAVFDPTEYIRLSSLPIIGGATATATVDYDTEITAVPYGTQYSTLQEVYDLIVGYGKYLVDKGFIFDEYQSDLEQVLDWKFSGREFLFWTTQNWADGSIITLSPFSQSVKYRMVNATVDNIFNSFYEYGLQSATGKPFPVKNFTVDRNDGVCSISTVNTTEGIYFVKLNLIQKEHAIIMNNVSLFGDIIYDSETGYKQQRVQLSGFITDDWNGDYLTPGFMYDEAIITNWKTYQDYKVADVVKYSGKYYAANENIPGVDTFDFTKWNLLGSAPVAELLPNFDYKISQFEDFYSQDIDNFDIAQQQLAQHLIGYTPRPYLTNIIADPIAQYKFYQGFIKEKGTANAIQKLSKASINNLNGQIVFDEEWAIRAGAYGNFTSYNEVEFPLKESDFEENTQIVKFVDELPASVDNFVSYILPNEVVIKSDEYSASEVFSVDNSPLYDATTIVLPVAGYVRSDDVTATAYNKQSLFEISDVSALNDGDLIWLGFREDGEWDVYRYTKQTAKVLSSSVTIAANELTFETDFFHGLSAEEIVGIDGLSNRTDGIYRVVSVPSLTTFTVATTFSEVDDSETYALLYKFTSVRVGEFDDISNLQELVSFKTGDKVWADHGDNETDDWKVYENRYNFNTSTEALSGVSIEDQQYGFAISTYDGADRLVASSPYYASGSSYGRIFAFALSGRQAIPLTNYGLSATVSAGTSTEFGYAIAYDQEYDLIVAGAPLVNAIQVNQIDRETSQATFITSTIGTTSTNARYGSSINLAKNTAPEGLKIMMVGAPRQGRVYNYTLQINTGSTVTSVSIDLLSTSIVGSTSRDYALASNHDGTIQAIGISTEPQTTGTGIIYVSEYFLPLRAPILKYSLRTPQVEGFASSIAMPDDASIIVVASDQVISDDGQQGAVYVYEYDEAPVFFASTKPPIQVIKNPFNNGMIFGTKVTLDSLGENLLVSATGTRNIPTAFSDGTQFDSQSTSFVEVIEDSGTVYKFERRNEKFVFACELFDTSALNIINQQLDRRSTGYGASTAIVDGDIYIGAPQTSAEIVSGVGTVHYFKKTDVDKNCWNVLREQNNMIDLTKINRVVTIDSRQKKVLDYVDVFDPAKGRIPGVAEQEIRFKTINDPAIYSLGTQAVVVNNNSSWVEDHVGDLWWDLSTAKYVWYEQGEDQYRKNSWGKLFPGASIDVYEWVRSEYLPSQWSALADTTDGLAQGISGQPRYPNNNAVSVKQNFNASTGQNTNIYFYWVKNTSILPRARNRRITAAEVAGTIFDPASFGVKYVSLLSPTSLAVTNLRNSLVNDDIYMNIAKDAVGSKVNRHTEWLLMGEGNPSSMPTKSLDQKMIDSLVGKDRLGNTVPNPLLSDREKYGIEIRPRQSMFVNRTQALRNAVDYINTVMEQFLISDMADFSLLNSTREIPDVYSRQYDRIVTDYQDLLNVPTTVLTTAELICSVSTQTGAISSVSIVNSGTGYTAVLPIQLDINGDPITWAGPTVTIGDGTGNSEITTEINEAGNVVTATIVLAGAGLTVAPILTVRPYTVIVTVDENSNNRWAKYEWNESSWNKVFTQDFNTPEYWDYVNWTSDDYDELKPIIITVGEFYELAGVDLATGDYARVNNQGNGRYVILRKSDSNGTFGGGFDLVLSENGTIQFSDTLWDIRDNPYNFDNFFTYDQTLYDQTPEVELTNILLAIKNDVFVGPLKEYWNRLFFACVRYAMTEQKFLDWAFKTALLNVRNLAGSLDQRPVYKFQNGQYYEDYIKEVKPYHSSIRNYQINYDILEPTNSYITDFDVPVYYDDASDQFTNVLNDEEKLGQYPWKSWNDNRSLFVSSISVGEVGSGYTAIPTVSIVPAPGDPGSGATAQARISLGKLIAIDVTNGGLGYLQTPAVVISGGGSINLIPAKAYPIMSNRKVRANTTEIKFDRVSTARQIGQSTYTDSFIGDGETIRFTLSWAASNQKSLIDLKVDGLSVLATDYAIETYRFTAGSYKKLYSDLVLDTAPTQGQIITITYTKNIALFNAVDRIEDYYSPTVGMPGLDLSQLMTGIEYPGAQIQGLPFDYSANWDVTPFGESQWGDQSNSYTTAIVTQTAATGTTTLVVSTTTGITVGLRVNTVVISTLTVNESKFVSDVVRVQAVNTATNEVTFSTATTNSILANTVKIEFWDFNLTPGILDTVLEGGFFTGTTLIGALGVDPEDVIIDGETFISPNISHSPEELVKGEIHESLAINIYTGQSSGSPTVMQDYMFIDQTTATTSILLMAYPSNTASIIVAYDNQLITQGVDYSLNFENRTLVLNTQTTMGILAITLVNVGGTGFYNNDSAIVSNTTTVSAFVSPFTPASGIYATLNGYELAPSEYTVANDVLTTDTNGTGTNVLQVWSFTGGVNAISAVRQQTFIGDGIVSQVNLLFMPGIYGSPNSQVIADINGRILTAPNTVYHTAMSGQVLFEIDPYNQYPTGIYDLSKVEAYVNGVRAVNGVDFIIDQPTDSVKFKIGYVQTGDDVAITNFVFSDYYIDIATGAMILRTSAGFVDDAVLRVISFNNNDSPLVRTEVFQSRTSKRYLISREVVNDDYVWVTIGGKALTNRVDYYIDDDYQTVIIRDSYPYLQNESVTITSIVDTAVNSILGYKVFTDMLNRTQYKRLSAVDSTQLEEVLYNTSTQMVVSNARALTAPNLASKTPGVAFVAGERIEFWYVNGNVITGLRRGTLGTGARDVYPIGTTVADQSVKQNIPYHESIHKQLYTATTATTYNITGISLTTTTAASNQLSVFYGGTQLIKRGYYKQDTTIRYDNDPIRVIGSVSTTTDLPPVNIIGVSLLVTATNQVWTYADSLMESAIGGYIYRGVNFIPAQFQIVNVVTSGTTSTAQLILNFPTTTGTHIVITQRIANNNFYSNTQTSLINDTGIIPSFMRDSEASLPDKYYYGRT